jgi:hypothetical protein
MCRQANRWPSQEAAEAPFMYRVELHWWQGTPAPDKITVSAEAILRHIAKHDPKNYYWIDALWTLLPLPHRCLGS